MSDIVERLRNQSILDVWHPMMLEAAAEIEKLRAILSQFAAYDDEQFLVMMAAMAMQGMMSMEISMKAGMEEDIISIMAFDQAEAMLAEWKKRRAAAAALKETGE